MGRIDFARLPDLIGADFLPPSVDTEEELEVALLRQYLTKNHRYRMGRLPVGPRVAAMEANGSFSDAETEAARAAGPLFGQEYGVLFTGIPYVQKVPCILAFLCGFGQSDGQNLGGSTWYRSKDFKWFANEPPVIFYNLEGSWFTDWDSENNFMRALLATPNYGLACLAWGGWAFDRLALGGNLAEAMLNHRYGLRASDSIMGDPTLRVVQVPPVQNLSGYRDGNTVVLHWVPRPESGTTYFVYRSLAGLDGFGAPLNPLPVADNRYTDSDAPPGARYMVRSCRLITTKAGSYFDLGQGAFVTVP